MPKLQTSSIADTLFRLNGLDYGKNQYQLVYNNVQATDNVVDEAIIEVGLFSRHEQKYLVQPTPVNTWIDSSDTPYASLTALITAIESIVGFDEGGGGVGGTTIYTGDSSLTGDRIVSLGTFNLDFQDADGESMVYIDPVNKYAHLQAKDNLGAVASLRTEISAGSSVSTIAATNETYSKQGFLQIITSDTNSEAKLQADEILVEINGTTPTTGQVLKAVDGTGLLEWADETGGGGNNIYNIDGILTGDRIVSLGAFNLDFQDVDENNMIHISQQEGQSISLNASFSSGDYRSRISVDVTDSQSAQYQEIFTPFFNASSSFFGNASQGIVAFTSNDGNDLEGISEMVITGTTINHSLRGTLDGVTTPVNFEVHIESGNNYMTSNVEGTGLLSLYNYGFYGGYADVDSNESSISANSNLDALLDLQLVTRNGDTEQTASVYLQTAYEDGSDLLSSIRIFASESNGSFPTAEILVSANITQEEYAVMIKAIGADEVESHIQVSGPSIIFQLGDTVPVAGQTLKAVDGTGLLEWGNSGGNVYNSYVAILTQNSSFGDPYPNVMENTLGDTVTWTRTGVGTFEATLPGGFPAQDKVVVFFTIGGVDTSVMGSYNAYHNGVDTIILETRDPSGTLADTGFSVASVEIRTYP